MSDTPEIADLNQLKDILKRKSGVGGAVTAAREGRFFEWFIVVGPQPKPLESIKPAQTQTNANSSPATSAKSGAKYSNTLSPEDINPNYSTKQPSPSSSPKLTSPLSRGHSEPSISSSQTTTLNLSRSESDLDNKKNGDNEEPQIIFKFPPDKDIPVEVVPFCWAMPNKTRKKPANVQSKLNNAIYGQLSMLEKAKNSFLFLLIHDKDVFYGICVMNKEILHRYPSFARTTQPRQQIDVNSPLLRPVNRVYCFMSRFPFFKLHYNVLYSILARERLYLLEEASAGIQTPSHHIQLDDSNENEILSLLKSYYSKDVPKAGSSLSFKLPGELHSVDFKCPEAEEDQLVADWCLPIMFKALQCDTILTLLAAAITEKLIVFVCPNRGILSSLVLSMIPMLRPLIWQGPLIPILPRHMYEYLQAPVPYIVGVLDLPQDLEAELTNALIVKVDAASETVKLPNGGITPLPEQAKLQSTLKHYSQQMFKADQRFPDPYKTKKEEFEMAAKIMTELQNFNIENVLEVLRPHIKPGILQIMDKTKFLNSVPKKNRPFFSLFIETQQFSEFLQHFAQAKSEQEETTQVVLAQMEEKIQGLEKQKRDYLEKIHECEEQITYLRQNQHALLSQQNPTKSNGLIKASIQHLTKSLPNKKGEQK